MLVAYREFLATIGLSKPLFKYEFAQRAGLVKLATFCPNLWRFDKETIPRSETSVQVSGPGESLSRHNA